MFLFSHITNKRSMDCLRSLLFFFCFAKEIKLQLKLKKRLIIANTVEPYQIVQGYCTEFY